MGTQSTPDDLPHELGKILSRQQQKLGMSLRQISEKSGVSHMTVKRLLDGDHPVSVNNFMAVARALDLTAWKVYKQAEETLHTGLRPVPDPIKYAEATEEKYRQLMQTPGKAAAKTHDNV